MSETSRLSILGRHQTCSKERIKVLSDSVECNHPSRNTSSLLYSESCLDGNWRSHVRESNASPRPPPKISLKHDWKRDLGSEDAQRPDGQVVQQFKSSQSNQPTPNPDHDRTVQPVFLQSRIEKQKNYLERISREIETKQQNRLEILQKWIEADQELDAAHAKQVQAKHEMSILVAEQTAENAKAVNQGTSGIQSLSSGSNPDPDAQQTFYQCSNLFSRCKAWCATALRNSSWQLVRQMRKSRKSVRLWHKQCGNWRVGILSQNQGSKLSNLRVMWWYWTQSSLRAYLDSAAWTSKAKKPSRGVCRTQPQKRDVWRRNASKKRMSYSLLCLWRWIRFIAVPFYLTLSRVGEAENAGLVCATAKLFGAKYDAIGQWAQNLSSKSEAELEPLFAQVGECRQMFSERFGKDCKPYTSSVSQDIHSTHSHLDRFSLPVSPERDGDLAHTQQFCDYLSLFQEDEQSGRGQNVLSNLHFRGMEGKERSNPFCHHATRGGRKHTGKKRKLDISKGVVNILQCNVTTWSEHARHYILTSDFDATLISETHLGKERLLSAVTEAKKSGWAGWNQATGPISATICSVLEAGWKPSSPGFFWQTPDGSATLDGALFNKAQSIDSFSSDMVMRHSSSSCLERGIITSFAKKARSQLIKEGNFMAARALDFLVCGATNEPHLPADGSIPNQFFCVRSDQRVLATRKHELWECPGNTLINHTHMKDSEYLTSLAQEFWDTDQVLFARGFLPRDWLPASELAECNEVKMWESVDFNACAKNRVLFASDGSGGSR